MSEDRTSSPAFTGEPGEPVFCSRPEKGSVELIADPIYAENRPQDIAEPFVIVDDSGVFTRVFLARVHTMDGTAIPAVLKVQKDFPSTATPGFGRSFTTRDAIDAIVREAECRAALSGDQEGIVSDARSGGGEHSPIVSLPVTYCKKTAEFFHPVCPDCSGYLRDCRDEIALGKAGLPSYAEGSQRVLYCPDCHARDAKRTVFYSGSADIRLRPGGSAHLRIGSQLYRDFGRLITQSRKGSSDAGESSPSRAQFSCDQCLHQNACYPVRESDQERIPAEDMLYPVAYYEFVAVARELCELQYDEFCQFLGGRDWNELKAQVAQRFPVSALGNWGIEIEERYGSKLKFFSSTGGDSPGLDEALWLKLGLFEQLCTGVEWVYEHCKRPHLNLNPREVRVALGRSGSTGPTAWSFRLGIVNPAAAVPVAVGGDHPCYLNPLDANPLYTSSAIRRPPFGHEEYANVAFRGVEAKAADISVEVDLTSEVLGVFKLNEKDRFRVTLSAPGSKLNGVSFWAEGAATIPGGYRVAGRVARPQPGVAEALASALEQTFWDCRVNICRFYGVSCDLYSLGMMLLCGLSANDSHTEADICRAVENISRRLNAIGAAENVKPVVVERELKKMLIEHAEMFAPRSVLYHAGAREVAADEDLGELWFACQKLGFAMTTEIAGFSLMAGRREIGSGGDSILVKNARERLKDLNLWAEGRLFSAKALRRELTAAVSI